MDDVKLNPKPFAVKVATVLWWCLSPLWIPMAVLLISVVFGGMLIDQVITARRLAQVDKDLREFRVKQSQRNAK